jgi:D-alanyl-D-alanine carboxypeptidase
VNSPGERFTTISLCVTVMFLLTGCGGGNSSTGTTGPQPQTLGSVVDALAESEMEQQDIPGMTVALAKNGTMLYVKAYGASDLATQLPTQPSMVFQIGSITKQFTAALIMQLQEQGKLQVDDSINEYLPEYNFPPAITLRMLLTHTSGLPNYTSFAQISDWEASGVSEMTVLTAVSQLPLLFAPGAQWSYSNSNYFALGAIIEKITGQSYATILAQSIFKPLGLTSTFYPLPPPSQSAIGYTATLAPALIVNRSALFAAGALSSNVYDLVAWDNALIHGKVVSPASFAEMTTSDGFSIPGGGSYGFGLALRTWDHRPTIWHNGGINGFSAETDVFLDDGFAIVVLINRKVDADAITLAFIGAVCNSAQLSSNC